MKTGSIQLLRDTRGEEIKESVSVEITDDNNNYLGVASIVHPDKVVRERFENVVKLILKK